MSKAKISKVRIHTVIPDQQGELFDCHTHGLEALGHKELQCLVPGFCRMAAVVLLQNHVGGIETGDRFSAGDHIDVDGMPCTYIEVAGHEEGDPTRLRIVDAPQQCRCAFCGENHE